jgi:hypothetical protein
MKMRRRKTTNLKLRKEVKAARRRGSSSADLQKQLVQRTRERDEARKPLAEALEQQAATSEINRHKREDFAAMHRRPHRPIMC